MNELPSETGVPDTPGAADAPGQSPLQRHRGMVILVTAMGALLVVGLAVIAVTIIYRISSSDSQQNDAVAPAPASGLGLAGDMALPAAAIQLARPAGAELIGATSNGNRLTVHFRGPGGDTLVIIDLAGGAVISRVQVARSPDTGE